MRTTFIGEAEIDGISERVARGTQPWSAAFDRLRSDAQSALGAPMESVVDNGPPAGESNPHLYGTDAPYQGADGVFSDDINREDYLKAIRVGDNLRDLGLAYQLIGDDRYAEKAVDFAYHWFVDPDTYMHPSAVNYGPHTPGFIGQNSIEHYITIPKMLYGAGLVIDHPHWSTKPGDAVADLDEWVADYLEETESGGSRGGPEGDSIYKWWVANRAVAAAFIGSSGSLQSAVNDWRTTAFTDFHERGTFEFERVRSRGLYYSLSAIVGLSMTAEVVRHHGWNLYTDARYRTALDFHAPFLVDPSSWPWQELDGLEHFEANYGATSFELAYSRFRDGDYLDAVEAVGRPIRDNRLLGWVTATHANLFDIPTPPGNGDDEPPNGDTSKTAGALAAASTLAIAGSIAARRLKDQRDT